MNKSFLISDDSINSRLDRWLRRNICEIPQSLIERSLRKGKIIGHHKVLFSSGKEAISLAHEAFDRSLYSEGALTAAKWLSNKKPGLYSMRNVLNF